MNLTCLDKSRAHSLDETNANAVTVNANRCVTPLTLTPITSVQSCCLYTPAMAV